jgi:hypothetical protein
MAFRIRDLMINVMPQGGSGGHGTGPIYCSCGPITLPPPVCHNWRVSARYELGPDVRIALPCYQETYPPPTTTVHLCHPWYASAFVVNFPQFLLDRPGLAALKEQLRTALAEVEAQEKAAEEASRPRTREEAEELEEKLKGALEEVRGWKETLPGEGSK